MKASSKSLALPGAIAGSIQDGDTLAAIDMGSNSFHMIVARVTLGQLRVVDRLRETVRLGEGLYGKGKLEPEVRDRALACLSRFGQRIRGLPARHVRALATNAVRQMSAPHDFLQPAEDALGHPVEVISGREEARLVYQGVAHVQPPKPGERRLVIDIGGGSTECIIGCGLDPLNRESLQVGCISSTRRFFPNGKLSRKKWQAAFNEVAAQYQQFAATYRAVGWQETLGSSGTNYIFSFNSPAPEGALADTWYHSALTDALLGADAVTENGLPPDTPDIISPFDGDGNPVFDLGEIVIRSTSPRVWPGP